MKIKKKLIILFIVCVGIFFACFFPKKTYAAEENSVGKEYGYQVSKLDLANVTIYNKRKKNIKFNAISCNVIQYDTPQVDDENKNDQYLTMGKIIIKIDVVQPDANYVLSAVPKEQYTVNNPSIDGFNNFSDTQNLYSFAKGGTTSLGLSKINIGDWTDENQIMYTTQYDLQIINTTETDFIPYSGGKYIGDNWNSSLENYQFVLKSTYYHSNISKFNLKNNVQLAFGKRLEILDPKTTDTATTIDLRTDRKIRVTNADGSVSHDYTLHVEMPWQVNVPSPVSRNFNSVTLKYKNIDDNLQESKEDSFGGGLNNIYIPAGETVTGSLKAKDGENKIIKTLSLTTESGSSVSVKVMPNSNIFTFVMPADVVILPSKIEFEDADITSYSLNGKVSQIAKMDMGSIAFSDEEGNTIQKARAGQTVTATATPLQNWGYLEIAFKNWSADGVVLEDAASSKITFTMPAQNVTLTAEFEKKGSEVEIAATDYTHGRFSLLYGTAQTDITTSTSGPAKGILKNGIDISVMKLDMENAFEVSEWKVYEDGVETSNYKKSEDGSPIVRVSGKPIRIEVIVTARVFADVTVTSADTAMGSVAVGDGNETTINAFAGDKVKVRAIPVNDNYALDHWEVVTPVQDGAVDEDKVELRNATAAETEFQMIKKAVELKAVFKKVNFSTEAKLSDIALTDKDTNKAVGTISSQGKYYTVELPDTLTKAEAEALVKKAFKLKFTLSDFATATFNGGDSHSKEEWAAGQEVSGFALNQPMTIHVTAENNTDTQDYTLTITWNAKTDKELTAVTLQDSQKNNLGTGVATGTAWTVTLSQNLTQAEVDNLFKAGFYLKLTISDRAKAALEGAAGSTKEAWANGVKVGILKLNEAKKLTVTAEDGSTKEYTIKVAWSPKPTSKEKELTGVELLDKDKKVIAAGTLEGTAWTVEIPEDKYTKQQASNLANGGAYLKLTASEGATIAQKDGYDEKGQESWSSGNISTNMTLNREYTFIVTAENGSTKEYTIMLSYPTEKPVLKADTVTRSSDKEAKAVFNSTLAGKYYWEIVEKGAKEPTIDTSYAGSTAKKGNNTVTLTSLEAGAKDLYIVVKSSDGEVSDLLKMEIPAYDAAAEEYAITLSYPTSGGTLKASASKAKAGDKITITVTPKTGYKLTPGTLKYSEASSTGAVVNIDETTGTFTMPASEISISCTWTAESTDQPETTTGKIGAFVVNGVSGTVDNTTGTITVTLPNGTDLTSLAPVITISGAKSISPASGATVNLSSPVTYTLTLEDGTTKTYTVRAYVEGPSKSDQLWNDMLNNVDGSPDHSGSKTWWKKAKDLKKHNDYPEYW